MVKIECNNFVVDESDGTHVRSKNRRELISQFQLLQQLTVQPSENRAFVFCIRLTDFKNVQFFLFFILHVVSLPRSSLSELCAQFIQQTQMNPICYLLIIKMRTAFACH